ncbi:MAG: type II secretion system protein [Planctomycetes bacterium]|nr:type II secretion system protein [Planctomycetota bacterium]
MSPANARRTSAFSLLELMIVIGVMFVLASIAVAMMHKTSELSLQAHCMTNLRTLFTAVQDYNLNQRVYPLQYPQPAFPTLFSSYSLSEGTFTCLAYDEIDGDSTDVYSTFYIRPREDMAELLVLSCPYHDENTKTVTLTNRGRGEVAESAQLVYKDAEVEPTAEFEGDTINMADGSLVRLQAGLNVELIATYQIRKRNYLAIRVLQGETGVMDVELQGGSAVSLVCEAGVAVMDAEPSPTQFRVSLQTVGGNPTATITVMTGSGKATVYGDNMVAN